MQTSESLITILPIIHREWLLGKTHHSTWLSLSLITLLLQNNLWLVEQILEGEAWVNEQLKRLE